MIRNNAAAEGAKDGCFVSDEVLVSGGVILPELSANGVY